MGRKHCGKRRNCSLRAISPFPTVFSRDSYKQTRKNQGLFGKELNLFHTSRVLMTLKQRAFENMVVKGENVSNQRFPFSHHVFILSKANIILTLSQTSPCFYVSAVQVF